jgi:mRNA-degrading endonuclease RelE of RelBE toxin-antitoxin system
MKIIFPKPAGGLPAIKLRKRKDQIKSLDPNKRKKRERETENKKEEEMEERQIQKTHQNSGTRLVKQTRLGIIFSITDNYIR